jgi:hypothetical protein
MTSKFVNAMTTANGALSLGSVDPEGNYQGLMSLFFKAVRGLPINRLYDYLIKASKENIIDTFLLVFNIRDCRGGKGERELGRKSLIWLFINHTQLFLKIVLLIPEYGRWDDLLSLFPTVLDLTDINYVRSNFSSSSITEEKLVVIRSHQIDIMKIFTNKLTEDYNIMMEGKPCSLAAKWAPSEGGSLDTKTGVFKNMVSAMNITPKKLRKMLSALRSYIRIVEKYMCDHKWDEIDYNKVPSCAMNRLKKSFEKHDSERFNEWKKALSKNEPSIAKVNAKQLFPHELIKQMRNTHKSDEVLEAQWKVIVDECKKLGVFDKTLVVADTSSSMHSPNYLPVDVAVSMGLLISECVSGDFKDFVATFNTDPHFIKIKEGSLFERWNQVYNLPWGGSTDLEKTMQKIYDMSITFKLSASDMPKILLIVSDMQFNACTGSSITNYQNINKIFGSSGLKPPKIVFWNVNGSSEDFPVTYDEKGTCLISGFSPSIMKTVLNGSDMSPYIVMRNTLDDDRLLRVREALLSNS